MSHFARGLSVSVVATLLASSVVFPPTYAGATKISQADKRALVEATASCKAEAKGKKIRWPSSRSYVRNCVNEALKNHPNISVIQLYIDHPDMKRLPVEQVKDPM
jgi:hypothetical protein